MKKSRFNETQIIGVLQEQEAGSPTVRQPTATADATDQLSTPRALIMIEGPEGSRSPSMSECEPYLLR